jgi:hypothetical protein
MKKNIQSELKMLLAQLLQFSARYGADDVRTCFLDGYFQMLKTYYCAYFHLETDLIIKQFNEIYERKDIVREDLEFHIQNHKNQLNSFLIVNSWSNFEYCISLFAEAVLPIPEKSSLMAYEYDSIIHRLRGISIPETQNERLLKLIKPNLAHVPILLKYGKLFKMISTYPAARSIKNDREFLDFYGKLRNCIHSNYVFLGNENYEYTFGAVRFAFPPGNLIQIEPLIESGIFDLTKELKNIFMAIVGNIDYQDVIFDESVNLIK